MILTGTGTVQSEFLPTVCDSVTGTLTAAFSLRKVRTAYAGSAIRVRRTTDNALQDIGFDTNGNLDTAALNSFLGSANGRVRTWYDQSGNGRDFTNTVNTTQPIIYDFSVGGTILNNGRPTLSMVGQGFLGATQWFNNADQYASIVVDSRTTVLTGILTSRAAGTDTSPAMYYAAGPAPSTARSGAGCGAFNNANQLVFSAQFDEGVDSDLWVNSVLQSGGCTNGAYSNIGAVTILGASRNGEAYNSNYYLQEVLVWSTLMADNLQSSIVEANQSKYYSRPL